MGGRGAGGRDDEAARIFDVRLLAKTGVTEFIAFSGASGNLTRQSGIEAGRVIAFLAIVFLHSYPNIDPSPATLLLWDQLPRFAVPFFFITSGYFLWPRVNSLARVCRIVLRILIIFLFWVIAYNLTSPENLVPRGWWNTFLGGGVGFQLWFLSALAIAVLLSWALVRIFGLSIAVLCGAALFVIGTLIGPYHIPLGFPTFGFIVRSGPFFGFPFVALGMLFARCNVQVRPILGLSIFIFGAAAQVIECYEVRGIDLGQSGDFFFSTAIYGAGAFLFFSSLEGKAATSIGRFGKYVLGAYVIHVAIILWLVKSGYYGVIGWLAFVALTFIYSMTFSVVASKVPIIKRLVQ
ncbi:Surface polysaccharide O-acyltransferase, integral membrane enzyme [Kaistia soli DSM 19436]|uniref:Surface polysaccharide O-acyltransferase, integral membrane enzyme n=1 Tax=Kaistia soli DSM 19436 TaxID=1122133 RepID=A0A1M5MPT5_9HYPH|nr:acyltransferase [Kaistia soli]SHG78783.1 Surface polysaccharide O-acyltransferase, integral membrane enzyme [Kaistia soli DSM 19436]